MERNKKMGRPVKYPGVRRPRLIHLSDDVWKAIGEVAGEGGCTEFIEKALREHPAIAAKLTGKS